MKKFVAVIIAGSLIAGAVSCGGQGSESTRTRNGAGSARTSFDVPITPQVAAGVEHTCALLSSGAMKCWGSNNYGQLGLGNTDDVNIPTDLPVFEGGARATAISAGARHTCALFENGAVKCWGYNAIGQLGLGNTINVNLQTVDLDLGSGVKVTAIRAGGFHTCALFDNGAVKCWGFNKYGQLGLGDTNNRGGAPNEMGDNLPISYQFQIARVAQTITFSAPTDRVLSATPLTVTATSDSSLLMTLTSSTTSVCTVSGFQVTMLTAGLCTLTAGQTGDSTYLSATDVVRSFTITSVIPPSVPTTEGSTPTTLPTKGSTPTTLPTEGSTPTTLPTEGSTPTTLPTEGSTPTTPTTMVLKIVTPTVKKGKSISLSTINQSAKIVIPKKATVVMTVSKASKTICSVSKTTVKALAVGTCSLIVAVTPQATTKVKKPKTVKTPVEVIVTK